MVSMENSTTLSLPHRPYVVRGLLALMFLESLVLLGFGVFGAHVTHPWILCGIGFGLFGAGYYAAYESVADKKVVEILAVCQILIASLVVASGVASTTLHYALILSLGIIACCRNRRALAISTLVIIVEQSIGSVLFPNTVFLDNVQQHSTVVIEHLCSLGVAGGILLLFCDPAGESALPVEAVEEAQPKVLSPRAKKNAELAATKQMIVLPAGTPESTIEIVRVATEVGARAKLLHKTISNIEGPLRRMSQSINGANRGMTEIKDELSRTSASVIQVTKSSEMHAEKAKDVFQAADEAAYGSQIGAMSTEQTIRNMERIRAQMDSIAQRMDNLLTKSQLMVQVVGFADELALQSKVLSVNAAIEAAKAGDRGEGFSAVAREVKSLANQSKDATRQVRQILKEIQTSIAEVRRSIALGNETVDVASDQCRGTVESIRGLDSSVGTSRDAAESIMNSSKDQLQGMMQIAHAMNDIQSVSDQNAGSIGNLQVEAQKLNVIARDLMKEMTSYQSLVDELLGHCSTMSGGSETVS